jgi:hypothetical protein
MIHQDKEWLKVQYFDLCKTQTQIAEENELKQVTISKWLNIHFTKEELKKQHKRPDIKPNAKGENHWTKKQPNNPFLIRIKEGIRKGAVQSPEEIQKRLETRKGYKHSEATKIKLSLAKIGENNPQKKLKGEKSPFWKKEKTNEERIKQRKYRAYHDWRELVYIKDNYTCKKCNRKSGDGKKIILNAHHIENYSEKKELRLDVNNGITLCYNCHKKFHEKYTKFNNTKEQLDEFLQSKH